MSSLQETLADWGWRRIGFTILVLIPLFVYAGLVQGWRNQLFLITSWLGGVGVMPPEFLEIGHRLHEVAFAVVFWPLLIGLLAQLRSPSRHVAGQLMALVTLVGLLLAFAVTNYWDPAMILVFLGVPTVLAALLHPAGRGLVSSFSVERINRATLVLVVVAAVPLLAFTATQVGLQTGAIGPAHDHAGGGHDEEVHEQHVEFGHFTIVVGLVLGVIGVGVLASLQQPGWWVAAWITGLMVVTYGLAGLGAPEAASNPGLLWNLAAIIWGAGFIAVAEYTQDGEFPSWLAARGEAGETAL